MSDRQIEVYSRDAFITLTGQRVPNTPAELAERSPEIAKLWAKCTPPPIRRVAKSPRQVSPDDDRLIANALGAPNGEAFGRLWGGDWESDFPSKSEADFRLVLYLNYRTQGDGERIDRLFRQSGLYDAKWDRPDGVFGTYGWRTISRALA